jgi:hypothetical protein
MMRIHLVVMCQGCIGRGAATLRPATKNICAIDKVKVLFYAGSFDKSFGSPGQLSEIPLIE